MSNFHCLYDVSKLNLLKFIKFNEVVLNSSCGLVTKKKLENPKIKKHMFVAFHTCIQTIYVCNSYK